MSPITGASERIPGTFYDNGGAAINAHHPDYGIDPTGVADSALGIQAMLDTAAITGMPALFPPGSYRYSVRPVITRQMVVRGGGASLTAATSATVFKPDAGVGGILIDTNNAAGSVLEGIYFDSQSTVAGTDDGLTLSAPRCTIRRCAFDGFGRYGIFLTSAGGKNANLNRFEKCRTTNNFSDGFKSDGINDGGTVDSNNAVVDQLDSTGNGGYGINSGGGAALFIKPQLAANTAGSIRCSGNSPVILHPYIENDAGKAAIATSTSGYGMWISGSFGSVLPLLDGATPLATWTVQRKGNWERAIRIADETNGGKTWELSSGIRAANELAIKNATDNKYLLWVDVDGSGNPNALTLNTGVALNTDATFERTGQTTGAAAINLAIFTTLAAGQGAYITARVIGVKSDLSQLAGYTVICLAKNVGGTITIVTTQTVLDVQETEAAWNATFVVASGSLRLQVTGAAGETVNWKALISMAKV